MTHELSAFASTSPAGGETCPVCLRRLKNSRLGKPENCDHYFCFTCIHEWAKNINTCPVDRIPFNNIEVYSSLRGKLLDKVFIPNSNVIEFTTDPNDVTYCEICHQCDREESLLLCDGCDKGYHLFCLTPPLNDIPEGDWYCNVCLPIIHEQYDPSLVLESDFEDHNHQNLNSHSDDSSINVVDSDFGDSGMDWRPARSRNQLVVIEESSESSDDDKSTNQDSDDNSSDDEDTFRRRRATSKVTISTSSETESASDIDMESMGESSNRSRSYSKKRLELVVESGSSDEEDESDFDEDVNPLGKRSKSSQRIESDSDSNENFDSREPGDDSGDIQPIGNRLKRCKNSQRIESDSSDTNENYHSRESSITTPKAESKNGGSNITWKNTTIPLTRLKWKIPRKSSVSDSTGSDFANHDDTTEQSSTGYYGATAIPHSETVVKLEPGLEMSQRKAKDLAVYSDHHVFDDITMTSLPNTLHPNTNSMENCSTSRTNTELRKSQQRAEDTTIKPSTALHTLSDVQSKQTFHASQSNTKLNASRLYAEDMAGGPTCSTAHYSSWSDTHVARENDDSGNCRKRRHRRRRSKRNRQRELLADCPNSQRQGETWFDFRGIEAHLGARRRSSNTHTARYQQHQVHATGNDASCWGPITISNYGNDRPMNATRGHLEERPPPLLPTPSLPPPPPPPHHHRGPPLMSFVPPITSCNYVGAQLQPPGPLASSSFLSYPPAVAPYAYPPPPPPQIPSRGPPLQPPLFTTNRNSVTVMNISPPPLPQYQRSVTYLGSSDVTSAYGSNNPTSNFDSYPDRGACVEIEQLPKKKKQNRKRKKKSKVVLTVTRKSPKKFEDSSVPVSQAVLSKRERRSRRKKRKREEWKIKKRELKEAGQWPPPKRRKKKDNVMFLPESPRDPTYSPTKWDPKAVVQSDGCMTRARTAATNTPRKQAMREAVREAYRHEDHSEGLQFAREILAKQGRTSDSDGTCSRTCIMTTAAVHRAVVENGIGNGNGYSTTPTREGSSRSERPSSTPKSGYIEKSSRRGSSIGRHDHPVSSVPETPPSTMSTQHGNRTHLMSDSDTAGPSTSSCRSQEREQDYCKRIVDKVKRRTVRSRRTLSSVLVTPVRKAIVRRPADSSGSQGERVKSVSDQSRSSARASSSDLINQLCQNLDDLQNRNNIIQKDGSIVPIKGSASPPAPIDPLLSLSSTTPSPQMTSSVSPATTPQRQHRSHDHRRHPTPAYLTNQNHTTAATTTCSSDEKGRVWVTPEKWRDHYSSTSSPHKTLDSSNRKIEICRVNGTESRSSTSSPCAATCRSSQDGGRRSTRVVKRLLSSDSEPGRENGLPDYVTFVPDTPTATTDSNQSPFIHSSTNPTVSNTCSNSCGESSNDSDAVCILSSTTTADATSSLSRNSDTMNRDSDAVSINFDAVSSSTSTDDPKRYMRRLLKIHYHLGHITTYQFWRILERASRRVDTLSSKFAEDKLKLRKLVDDYVEAYMKATAAANNIINIE